MMQWKYCSMHIPCNYHLTIWIRGHLTLIMVIRWHKYFFFCTRRSKKMTHYVFVDYSHAHLMKIFSEYTQESSFLISKFQSQHTQATSFLISKPTRLISYPLIVIDCELLEKYDLLIVDVPKYLVGIHPYNWMNDFQFSWAKCSIKPWNKNFFAWFKILFYMIHLFPRFNNSYVVKPI